MATRRAVTPADIVELRALDVERNESRAGASCPPRDESPPAARRLWPFRWPTVDPPVAVQPLPIAATPEKGAYFDVFI
jgi:hypothetical protein